MIQESYGETRIACCCSFTETVTTHVKSCPDISCHVRFIATHFPLLGRYPVSTNCQWESVKWGEYGRYPLESIGSTRPSLNCSPPNESTSTWHISSILTIIIQNNIHSELRPIDRWSGPSSAPGPRTEIATDLLGAHYFLDVLVSGALVYWCSVGLSGMDILILSAWLVGTQC